MSFKKTILLDVLMDISKFAAASASMITKTTAMQKAMGAFSKALMGVFAAKAIFNGINNQIKVIGEFERAMSRVQAVAGATSGQMYFLTENAKQLGLSTRFTASEVAELSNELAKLGFSTDQILKLSKATLNLASISNASLADSARIVGSTIRAFNKDATESTHVVDVMAVAFTNSALDLEKFRTGMSIVAPVATQAGLSIEQTTAMLAQLADRGIDASMAGTGLRGILLDLSRHGLTMQQAFDKINNATDKNAMAFDLFGKRGATVATILAGTTEEIDKLSSSLINSLGAADKMSAVIEDNLIGDQKKLKSAWEALVLEGGILIPVLRSITQAMTAIVQSFNELAAERAKIAVMDKLEAIRNQQNIDLTLCRFLF